MAKRWRRDKASTGLAGACCGALGSKLFDGDVMLASTGYSDGKWNTKGWYWACPSNELLGITHENTCSNKVDTEKVAKVQAKNHIDNCIKAHKVKL